MDRHRPSTLALASLLLGLGLAVAPVLAGNDAWTPAGSPAGGNVNKVVVNPATPSILYATSGQSAPGVFESTDSGHTWTLVFPTLNEPSDLVIDPKNPKILYVAYSGDASKTLFKTTDGGATWTEADSGIGKVENGTALDSIGVLAVDPVTEGVVYAVSDNTGVYRSTDGGAHWSAIDTGLAATIKAQGFLNSLAVDPQHPQVLYLTADVLLDPMEGGAFAADPLTGLYQSLDSGAHWTQSLTYTPVSHVIVDPNNDQNVYAGGDGVYLSTDGGTSWASASGLPVTDVVAIDPTNSLHLWGSSGYNGLYQSTDGGATWNASTLTAGMYANGIAIDPVTPTKLYASSGAWGVFNSTDGGATWNQSATGIHNVTPNLMFEGSDRAIYLATGGSGIYKSVDQGVTWNEVGGGVTGSLPSTADFVYALVEDPSANSTLYAGSTQGLYKTLDGGNTWTESDTGIPSPDYILSLAIDPEVPATLYAATDQSGTGLYKSMDGGASWNSAASGITVSPDGGVQALAVDPHHSNVVYAGAYATGLYKSTDTGASWKPDDGSFGATDIWAIAVDPSNSSVVYVATTQGFFKSTDAGATWTESDSGLNGNYILTDIQIDPSNTSILYVSQRYGIGDAYVSSDAGATWYALTTGLSSSARAVTSRRTESVTMPGGARVTQGVSGNPITISAVAIDPTHHTQVFGGGSDGRIYTYDDLNPPTGGTTSGSGSSGSSSGSSGSGSSAGSGGTSGASSSGGGGAFPLILASLLLGLAFLRRQHGA
jgi:photosystem II stability/assembly factor-like uncharacterized protein